MGDRFATIDMGRKLGEGCALLKYLNFVCPLIATTPRHLHTHLLLLQHLLISPLSTLLLNLKSTRFFQTALISSPVPIPSPPGFSQNAHLCWSSQSLILSIFRSLPVSSTLFSKNLLFLHSSRNPPKTKISSLTTVQSLTFLSYPKNRMHCKIPPHRSPHFQQTT